MEEIDKILAERGSNYGSFSSHASITQRMKEAMWSSENWDALSFSQRECLEMVVHKIGRIVNGGAPDYLDSWTDIVGYVTLVINDINNNRLLPCTCEACLIEPVKHITDEDYYTAN